MVGGSGLYVNAVTEGLDDLPKLDASLREELNQKLQNQGLETLQVQLKGLDSKAFETIAIDNPQRVIRALEVCISSGKPYSSFLKGNPKKRDFKMITIGLTADRTLIYDRINTRVDRMIAEGLLDEVKALKPKQHLNALKTVGYKELFAYLDGEWSLEFAISEIKKNTRRFAKRQLTWFKKNEATLWFDYKTDVRDIITAIEKAIN
jgi:tRNA dimethylallyltransferase